MCPYQKLKGSIPQGIMDWNLFSGILDDFSSNGGHTITFNNFSEIFAIPQGIDYVLKAVTNTNLRVYLVSNGVFFTPEVTDALIERGFRGTVYVSCHAFSEETFQRVTGRANFLTVKNNISYLAQRHPHPSAITIQYISDFSPLEERLKARTYWRSLGVTINEMASHTFCDQSLHDVHKKFPDEHTLYGCSSWDCDAGLPFYQLVVQHDGRVTLCCMDVAGEVVLGDLKHSSISEAWNGKAFLEIIQTIYSGRLTNRNDFICNRCPAAVYKRDLRTARFYEPSFYRIINHLSQL